MISSHAPSFGVFADPVPYNRSLFGALRPAPKIRPSDWAARTRKLNNTGGGYVGPWDNAIAPYLVEPQDEMVSRVYDTMCIVGPAQCGKTAAVENVALVHKVPNAPSDVLWYMQNDEAVEAYVKATINSLIDDHWVLKSNLGRRPVDDSLHFKRFRRMTAQFLAFNRGNLINKRAGFVFGDEIDAYDQSVGDAWELFDLRRQTYGSANSMVVGASHPDLATGLDPERDWLRGIMRWYRNSTQGRWYWACPECARFSSPCPGAKYVCELVYPKDAATPLEVVAAEARLLCPHNGCKIPDAARGGMNRTGRWVHIGQDIDSAGRVEGERTTMVRSVGYWIVGVMSPFILGGIGELARKLVNAERTAELDGDEDTVREISAKALGIPRAVKTGKHAPLDAKILAARADTRMPMGYLPDGVLFLTVAIDTQKARFVVQVEGWGVDLERWIVDRFDILRPNLAPGQHDRELSPASYPEDWDVIFDQVVNRAWAYGSDLDQALRPALVVFDGYGEPGVTDNAYDFWLRMAARGYGRRIVPLKGEDGWGHPRVIESFLEAEKKDRFSAARGEVPVLRMRVNPLKDSVAAGLRREQKGARFINFPGGLPQSFFDEYTAEERGKSGWVKIKARNESLDLSAYNLGAAYHLQADKLDWKNPPIWATRAPGNPLLVSLKSDIVVVLAPRMENHGVALPSAPPPSSASVIDRLF